MSAVGRARRVLAARSSQVPLSASHISAVSAVRTARALRRAVSMQERMLEGLSRVADQEIDRRRAGVGLAVLGEEARLAARGDERRAPFVAGSRPERRAARLAMRCADLERCGRCCSAPLDVAREPDRGCRRCGSACDAGLRHSSPDSSSTQVSLVPPPWRRIDHQRALAQRHAGQAAGHDADLVARRARRAAGRRGAARCRCSTKVGQVDSASVGWAM